MRIGIDIDGVLTNVGQFSIDYLSKYCVENNIEFDIGDSYYKIAKTFNISNIDESKFWDKYLDFYPKYEKARPFASEVIKKLKDDGYKIYIITARWLTNRKDSVGNKMRETVKNWLAENDITYDELIFTKSDNENKFQEIIDNKIDLMIEDSPTNINELANITHVFCYNTDYNKNCNGENITRCYSWYDIYKKISQIK